MAMQGAPWMSIDGPSMALFACDQSVMKSLCHRSSAASFLHSGSFMKSNYVIFHRNTNEGN